MDDAIKIQLWIESAEWAAFDVAVKAAGAHSDPPPTRSSVLRSFIRDFNAKNGGGSK